MSDGPHRSLPMRPGWKRVAECGDNRAFGAVTFQAGAAASFEAGKITSKLRDYAIAGALHLDHLASLRSSPANAQTLNLSAFQLGRSLDRPEAETRAKLDRMLMQHEKEWKNFMRSLGQSSFIADWATGTL